MQVRSNLPITDFSGSSRRSRHFSSFSAQFRPVSRASRRAGARNWNPCVRDGDRTPSRGCRLIRGIQLRSAKRLRVTSAGPCSGGIAGNCLKRRRPQWIRCARPHSRRRGKQRASSRSRTRAMRGSSVAARAISLEEWRSWENYASGTSTVGSVSV